MLYSIVYFQNPLKHFLILSINVMNTKKIIRLVILSSTKKRTLIMMTILTMKKKKKWKITPFKATSKGKQVILVRDPITKVTSPNVFIKRVLHVSHNTVNSITNEIIRMNPPFNQSNITWNFYLFTVRIPYKKM